MVYDSQQPRPAASQRSGWKTYVRTTLLVLPDSDHLKQVGPKQARNSEGVGTKFENIFPRPWEVPPKQSCETTWSGFFPQIAEWATVENQDPILTRLSWEAVILRRSLDKSLQES